MHALRCIQHTDMRSNCVQAVSATDNSLSGNLTAKPGIGAGGFYVPPLSVSNLHKPEIISSPPVSDAYTGWQPGSNDLSLNNSLVAMEVDQYTPEQIRISLGHNVETMLVIWTTGAGFNFSEFYETPSTPLQSKVPNFLSNRERFRQHVIGRAEDDSRWQHKFPYSSGSAHVC